jgi:hypothetical protein
MSPAIPSAITAENNTPAGRARAAGLREPVRAFSQAKARKRRRQRLITERLTESFSPSREVIEVAEPLAVRIAELAKRQQSQSDVPPVELRFRSLVDAYADAVHECISALIGWEAEAEGRAKTTHLKDEPGKRLNAITRIKDLAQRPELPAISAATIRRGSWPVALAQMAAAADGLRVASSYSDKLNKLLIETIDRAAGDLERRITAAESQPLPAPARSTDPRAELAALGIET